MAEIQLTHEQQQQLASLAKALGSDAALRGRFQQDVGGVLAEYGLSGLLPAGVTYEAVLDESEVSGYAFNSPQHIDDYTHIDSNHLDAILNIAGFRVAPRLF
jgi:hypothetical protein